MSVNDRERNDQLSKEIDNGIIKYQNREREIVLLGDFNGHVGYLGKHTTNKNGDRVLQLMERQNMILLNDDPDCKGPDMGKNQINTNSPKTSEILLHRPDLKIFQVPSNVSMQYRKPSCTQGSYLCDASLT